MENKRKAGASNGGDRDSKRRRAEPPQPSDFDLSKGETPESTTAYGLNFLELLRRTEDKNGRQVVTYFETLPLKSKNEAYYKKIKMPISLPMIERRLKRGGFQTLAEVESHVKRMVSNAKEFYTKNSQEYEDAERVRKAVSNYMTRTNPAYKKVHGYSAQATAISSEPEEELVEELALQGASPPAPDEDDEDGEDDEDEDEEGEEGEEGDEEEAGDGDDNEEEDGEEDEEDEEADDDEDDDVPRNSRRGRIVKINISKAQPKKSSKWSYEDVPYDGLSFQKAQEKVVEELMRREDKRGDLLFVNFIDLPSRQYKDYFNVIQDPLSLRGLFKLVTGKKGRAPPTGRTKFTSWQAFGEKASLLWTNAHYYNEEGSEVYVEATKLKEHIEAELKKVMAVVQDPPQSKIKLKVPPGQEPVASRKISINVGGQSTSASPAPASGRSMGSQQPSEAASGGTPGRSLRTSSAAAVHAAVVQVQSASASLPSPSPSAPAAQGEAAAPSPAPAGATATAAATATPNGVSTPLPNGQPAAPVQNGHPLPVKRPSLVWDQPLRAPGRGRADALLESLVIRTHPHAMKSDERFRHVVQASPKLAQQTIVIQVPPGHHTLQIIPQIAPLEQQRRQYRAFVQWQDKTLPRSVPVPSPEDPLPHNALVFDAPLQPGGNRIAVSIVAALPHGDKLPDGEEAESEKFTILAHLAMH